MLQLDYTDNLYALSPMRQLMLAALVKDPPESNDCFQKWVESVDFEALSHSSFSLIPALFHKFSHVKNYPYYARMKGIHRYSLSKNSLILAKGRAIFEQLIEAKVDFLLFEGGALILKYYKNYSIRPMQYLDFLVHRKDVLKAEKIMRLQGLFNAYTPEEKSKAFINNHAFNYKDVNNTGYDLHWYALYECCIPGIDEGIWQRAQPMIWNGFRIKVMAPEDLLLTSCINGLRYPQKRDNWMLDVIKIIQSENAISWDTLYAEARNRNLSEQLFDALTLIQSISNQILPTGFIDDFLTKNPPYYRKL